MLKCRHILAKAFNMKVTANDMARHGTLVQHPLSIYGYELNMSGCHMHRVAEVAGMVVALTLLVKVSKAFSSTAGTPRATTTAASASKGSPDVNSSTSSTGMSRSSSRVPPEL